MCKGPPSKGSRCTTHMQKCHRGRSPRTPSRNSISPSRGDAGLTPSTSAGSCALSSLMAAGIVRVSRHCTTATVVSTCHAKRQQKEAPCDVHYQKGRPAADQFYVPHGLHNHRGTLLMSALQRPATINIADRELNRCDCFRRVFCTCALLNSDGARQWKCVHWRSWPPHTWNPSHPA